MTYTSVVSGTGAAPPIAAAATTLCESPSGSDRLTSSALRSVPPGKVAVVADEGTWLRRYQ